MRRGRGGAADRPADLRRPWSVGGVRGSRFQPQCGRSRLVSVSQQARPSRERHRDPGSATAAAVVDADVPRACQGRRRLQPPPGQRPWRAQVIASRAPGPPVIPWVQPRVRSPRGAATPPPRPHRGQPSDGLQQELLPAQHAGEFLFQVKELFSSLGVECNVLELDRVDDGADVQELLSEITNQRTVPNIFVNKVHVGGCDRTFQAHQSGLLQKLLQEDASYDFDLIVLGGGSGGLACAQEAAILGKKVMVLDFVVPSPQGTSWGLGGTCVNVGCIPKKLMHQAALLGQALTDSRKFGWEYNQQVKHNWETMTEAIQNHISSLNWGYRLTLREKSVAYINSYGEFVEHHKIKNCVGGPGNAAPSKPYVVQFDLHQSHENNSKYKPVSLIPQTALCLHSWLNKVIVPSPPPLHLAKPVSPRLADDDLFSLPYCPGKTLVVGASYVALECAGFLAGLGLDVTIMVRSILLRGFDQEMAEKVGSYMEQYGVKFIRKFVPVMVQQLEKGSPGKLKVVAKSTEGPETMEGVYNTSIINLKGSWLLTFDSFQWYVESVRSGKIPVNDVEQTNVPYVYAIGDILEGKIELTPVAVQAGKLLARRLFGGHLEKCDYSSVPTTVFTPLEYGCCGLSEEKAIEMYQKENLEVRL
ncbi:hypothetical protein MC885_019420 [Smutsia gigantea]|nr:hypothetical protein MC885_019420 [Smutsia gigantea]